MLKHTARQILLVAALVSVPDRLLAQALPGDARPLGLDPAMPQQRTAGVKAPTGTAPETDQDALDVRGYLLLPVAFGVQSRDNPLPTQSKTAIHAPALVPEEYRSFHYTGVLPAPWAQLNLRYGNSTMSATAVIAAASFSEANGYLDPVKQLGLYEGYLTANFEPTSGVPIKLNLGAITGRYGAMGEYDAGRYATPLIARTNSIGETLSTHVKAGAFTILLEQGIGGQLGRAPRNIPAAGWNDFADGNNVGASLLNHVHAGVYHPSIGQVGLHYLRAWSQDDHVGDGNVPSGSISVLAADTHLSLGPAGHLFFGIAHTKARDSAVIGGIIEILNARGGRELIDEYLGPNSHGNGALTTVGGQYDLSLARLVSGQYYQGTSPDLRLSLFGVAASVSSDDAAYDGVTKLKAGAEATYSLVRWFGVSLRGDHVAPTKSAKNAYNMLSSRLLFHTDWQSRDEVSLQYSYFSYGSQVAVRTGYPPVEDPSVKPDAHVLSLTGTYWW